MKKALILVDIQNDFMPGGALAVAEGDQTVGVANSLMPYFNNDFVVATQDYHPENHGSFETQYEGKNAGDFVELAGVKQILWPKHCVQGTHGAEFTEGLNLEGVKVFTKGTDPKQHGVDLLPFYLPTSSNDTTLIFEGRF